MKKLILFLVLIETIIIFSQGLSIYSKRKVLGQKISVSPLLKENLITNSKSALKYFYEPKPNSIQTQKLDWLNYQPGYTATQTINEDGLNNKENYTVEKPKDTFRIITLGDSFTFGQNVNTANNYPSQLENLLNQNNTCKNIKKFEVLNLGVPGYDIHYTVERYKLRGQKYNPDLVLWLLISDDLLRVDELLIPKAKSYREQLKATGQFDALLKQGKFYSDTVKARQDTISELGGKDNVLMLQKEYLQQMNDLFKNPLIVFTIKSFKSFEEKNKNLLEEFVRTRKNSSFYSSTVNLNKQDDTSLPDGHPTKKGHQLISAEMFNYLKDNNIIPCQ